MKCACSYNESLCNASQVSRLLTYLQNLVIIVLMNVIKLKCTKFNLGGGSAPDPTEGAHSTLPDPPAGLWRGRGNEREGGL